MTDIQKARDVLKEWRHGATEDRWVPRLTPSVIDRLDEGERVVAFGGYSDADAELIVGTAGNPALLDAIDGLLEEAQRSGLGGWLGHFAVYFAAAIIAADERMSA